MPAAVTKMSLEDDSECEDECGPVPDLLSSNRPRPLVRVLICSLHIYAELQDFYIDIVDNRLTR